MKLIQAVWLPILLEYFTLGQSRCVCQFAYQLVSQAGVSELKIVDSVSVTTLELVLDEYPEEQTHTAVQFISAVEYAATTSCVDANFPILLTVEKREVDNRVFGNDIWVPNTDPLPPPPSYDEHMRRHRRSTWIDEPPSYEEAVKSLANTRASRSKSFDPNKSPFRRGNKNANDKPAFHKSADSFQPTKLRRQTMFGVWRGKQSQDMEHEGGESLHSFSETKSKQIEKRIIRDFTGSGGAEVHSSYFLFNPNLEYTIRKLGCREIKDIPEEKPLPKKDFVVDEVSFEKKSPAEDKESQLQTSIKPAIDAEARPPQPQLG